MIQIGDQTFLCDECGACDPDEIARKLQTTERLRCDPQLEYCWCNKTGGQIEFFGDCGDAYGKPEPKHRGGGRNTGRAYRRWMRKRKHDEIMEIMTYGYNPSTGYLTGRLRMESTSQMASSNWTIVTGNGARVWIYALSGYYPYIWVVTRGTFLSVENPSDTKGL